MDVIPSTPHQPEKHIEGKVVEDIKNWIQSLTQNHPEIGGFSLCPYAKEATVYLSSDEIIPVEGFDVCIFVVGDISKEGLFLLCETLNKKYPEYIFLDDHKDDDTYINGLKTNNGKYNLILSQNKEKLLKAREMLHKTKYYSYWSEEFYKKIIG